MSWRAKLLEGVSLSCNFRLADGSACGAPTTTYAKCVDHAPMLCCACGGPGAGYCGGRWEPCFRVVCVLCICIVDHADP